MLTGPLFPPRRVRHQPDDRAGIDTARKKCPQRNVGHHLACHRTLERLPERLGRLVVTPRPWIDGRRIPVPADVEPAVVIAQVVRRRKLLHRAEHRAGGNDVLVRKELVERLEIDGAVNVIANQQRLDLGRQEERVIGQRVVERLLAGTIPRRQQGLRAAIPERERKHATNLLEEALTPLLVGMYQYLDIGLAAKAVALCHQPLPHRLEIVDLAVRHEMDRTILALERLLTAAHVDDRQATHRETDTGEPHLAFVIGATMAKRPHHPSQFFWRDRPVALTLDDADDSAH